MAPKKTKALIPANDPKLLTTQAQDLYNQLQDLKEEVGVYRGKRTKALMENPRYATLKTAAEKIVKEASGITHRFDLDHPGYKKDIQACADDAREVHIGLAKIAIQAIRQGVELEIYSGVGKSRKRVQLNFSVQATLFGE